MKLSEFLVKNILLRLLYLTPFGYLLSTLSLLQEDQTKGISITLEKYSPLKATISTKPSFQQRLNWLINGLVLIIQAGYILIKQIAGDIGGTYALVSLIFGMVSIISSIFPNIQWNKNLIKKKKLILFFIAGIIFIFFVWLLINLNKSLSHKTTNTLPERSLQTGIESTIQPSLEATSQPIPLATSQPSISPESSPTQPLIELGLYGLDYSDGLAVNYVTSVKVSLFKQDSNTLIETKISPATVEPIKNNIRNIPSVVFYVPQGTYTFKGETDTLVGSGEFTVPPDKGPQYRPISMYIKPSTVTGKLFVDKNNNAIFDSGDETLANQPIQAFFYTPNNTVLSANETRTNNSGDFVLILDKYAGKYQIQTDLNLPYMYPGFPQFTISNSQQIQQNIFLLPR